MPAPDPEPRRRGRMDRAAMASNWRQVLLADAAMGAVVVVAGGLVGLFMSLVIGAVVVVAGLAYSIGGLLRWRRWARLRADAGLDQRGRDDTAS